jgi:hypothetical protein
VGRSVILKCPINSLSFGNVAVNFLYQLREKGVDVCLLPVGTSVDLAAFDGFNPDFKKWVEDALINRYLKLKRSSTFINLWHINGAEGKISDRNILYTFYEASEPTEEEVNIVNLYDTTCFSSNYASERFSASGAKNAISVPIGFDPTLHETDKEYLKNKTHFGLMGKWEKRKNTRKIISTWAKTYGNNYDYQLSCCINNTFLKEEELEEQKLIALEGKEYGNINFLPRLPLNSQVNDFLNSIDIDLSGMSGAEGWNLPSFNATALGKWSIVLNCTAHKDWATEGNSILVEPSGTEDIEDGVFFNKGGIFNVGSKFTFEEQDLIQAMEKAETKQKEKNEEGKELQVEFSYSKAVDRLLEFC